MLLPVFIGIMLSTVLALLLAGAAGAPGGGAASAVVGAQPPRGAPRALAGVLTAVPMRLGCRRSGRPPWSSRVAAAVVTMAAIDLGTTLVTVLVIDLATALAVPMVAPMPAMWNQGVTGRTIHVAADYQPGAPELRCAARGALAASLACRPRRPDNARHEREKHHLRICPAYRQRCAEVPGAGDLRPAQAGRRRVA